MKNADMPAMPVAHRKQVGSIGECLHHDVVMEGLTKREDIAKHLCGHIYTTLVTGYTDGNWDSPDHADIARESVMMADALLKELEK